MLLTPEQAAEQYAELSKTGKNFQECQDLELVAFEVASAAHLAIASKKVQDDHHKVYTTRLKINLVAKALLAAAPSAVARTVCLGVRENT